MLDEPIHAGALLRSLSSRKTALTALAMIAVLSIELDWQVVLVFVPLLYAHEIGHALAAIWRGLEVRGAPIFIPGLGAYVQTEPRTRAWDEVWVVLSGPALGAFAAVAVKLAGARPEPGRRGAGRGSGVAGQRHQPCARFAARRWQALGAHGSRRLRTDSAGHLDCAQPPGSQPAWCCFSWCAGCCSGHARYVGRLSA